MGYDCYVRTAAGLEYNDPKCYFRRSIFSGRPLAEALIALDMGYDPAAYGLESPDFPDSDEYGVTYEEWQDENGDWQDGYKGERAAEYEQAAQAALSWHGVADIPGIPVHKVCTSNDGWHVTKLECQAALGIYRERIAAGAEHPAAFRDDFIPFLEVAAQHDGFEVH